MPTHTPLRITRSVQLPDRVRLSRYLRVPELGPRILFFSGGTLIYLMSKSRFLTAISEGRCNVDDRETTMRRLVAYNVAGLRALAAKEPS